MSTRDIIEAAKAEYAIWWDKPSLITSCPELEASDVEFIAHFSPAHVALMEDVCEAAEAFLADCCLTTPGACEECDGAEGCTIRSWRQSLDALAAYRKEQGDE